MGLDVVGIPLHLVAKLIRWVTIGIHSQSVPRCPGRILLRGAGNEQSVAGAVSIYGVVPVPSSPYEPPPPPRQR